jgi:translation initiation factor IF-3
MDYGKYRYDQSKKAKDAKKKQSIIQVKEIKIRPQDR